MKVIKISDVKLEENTPKHSIFEGGKVGVQTITDPDFTNKEKISAVVINFSPGARTLFHTHTHPQILYVTEGIGRVATEKEEVNVTPGTIVIFPAGEKHLHGATKDSKFSHISISTPGETSW